MWRATIFTLFPAMFPGPLGLSLAGEALARGTWALEARDIREHGLGRHRAVDDTPAGGGPGMVLRADVLAASLDAGLSDDDPRPRLLLSPRGNALDQSRARALAAGPGVVLVCGRFEGVDERIIEGRQLEEISIGDYILSGGEIAAMVVLDACVRLLPGVMGKDASGADESFETGLLEYPHYTRPREWEGMAIPDILLSGNHAAISAWRKAEALRITRGRRPELLVKNSSTAREFAGSNALPALSRPAGTSHEERDG
jgi:tRNA (guanine37-N1)-methyltransferase